MERRKDQKLAPLGNAGQVMSRTPGSPGDVGFHRVQAEHSMGTLFLQVLRCATTSNLDHLVRLAEGNISRPSPKLTDNRAFPID